jgi:hypothetical protein
MIKQKEALEFTERLRECIDIGPGKNPIVHAKARRVLATLEAGALGGDVTNSCVELRALFDRWFSPESWLSRQDIEGVQRDLYRQLGGLESGIDAWFSPTDRIVAFDEQAD